jgi:TPR repeat protein
MVMRIGSVVHLGFWLIVLGRALVGGEIVAATSMPSTRPTSAAQTPTAEELDREAGKSPADAMRVGMAYYEGTDGVERDYAKAMKYFRQSADGGDTRAMCNVGLLYEQGNGVTQDYKQAMVWYRKAADAGDGDGMSNVGWLYHNGLGVE